MIAADKWKAKSAAMGQAVTEALVEYSRPRPGMNVIDLKFVPLEIEATLEQMELLANEVMPLFA